MRSSVVLISAAALVGSSACGGSSRRGPATPARTSAATATAPRTPATPAKVLAHDQLLASLAPTGADWEAKVSGIPAERARAVAIAFLREGNLACMAIVSEEVGCGYIEESYAPVAPDATLGDPCLRRVIAGWAIDRLEATDVGAVADALAAIVVMPQPERELMDKVVALVPPGDDALRLRLIGDATDAGRWDVADALLPGLTPAGAGRALVELHREAALSHLGEQPSAGVLAAALDAGLSSGAALRALDQIEPIALEEAAVVAAVRRAAGGDDCEVAARAAVLLDGAGDDQYLPSHATLRTEAEATRALCVAGHVSTDEALAVVRALVDADGLDLVDLDRSIWHDPSDPDPDLDGDGDPQTLTARDHVDLSELATDAERVTGWLPTSCSDGTCYAPTGTLKLSFGRAAAGTPVLQEITIERVEEGCGC